MAELYIKVRLDEELMEAFEKAIEKEKLVDKNKSAVVRMLIREYIEQKEIEG